MGFLTIFHQYILFLSKHQTVTEVGRVDQFSRDNEVYPGPNVPRHGKSRTINPISRGYLWVSYPQESLENTINTMGTLLGVHPIVPWNFLLFKRFNFLGNFFRDLFFWWYFPGTKKKRGKFTTFGTQKKMVRFGLVDGFRGFSGVHPLGKFLASKAVRFQGCTGGGGSWSNNGRGFLEYLEDHPS